MSADAKTNGPEIDLVAEFAARDMFSKAYVESRVKANKQRMEVLEGQLFRERLESREKIDKLDDRIRDLESKLVKMRDWVVSANKRFSNLEGNNNSK